MGHNMSLNSTVNLVVKSNLGVAIAKYLKHDHATGETCRCGDNKRVLVFPRNTENAFAPSKLWRRPLRWPRALQPWCTAVEVASHSRVATGQTGGPTDPVDSMF